MKYWLVKSEPSEFSISDLKRVGEEPWTGVRNFKARGYLQEMQVGDPVLFYHTSTADPIGVYGLAKVSRLAEPDPTQFDKKSKYYDARSKKERPYWYAAWVKYDRTFKTPVSREDMKADPKLKNMMTLSWPRLSVCPVTKAEFDHICKLGAVPIPKLDF